MQEKPKAIESKRAPEHEYHQDTVRVALNRLDGSNFEAQMLPGQQLIDSLLTRKDTNAEQLEYALFKRFSTVMPELTTVTVEIKANGKNVVNPNQLIFPGGGGRKVDPDQPISDKTILKIARNELFEEVHLNVHRPKIAHQAAYTYSFDHPHLPDTKTAGSLKNTTHLVLAKGAPHDRVNYFDPKDKLQNVVGISPSQVTSLFENNYLDINGVRYPIVDSLSNDPNDWEKANVRLFQEEQTFTKTIEQESYIYEALIQRKIIARLVTLSRIGTCDLSRSIKHFTSTDKPASLEEAVLDLAKSKEFILKIEKRLDKNSQIDEVHFSAKTIDALSQRGVKKDVLARRSALITLMSEAVRQVRLDTTTEFYREAGPQFPLLLSHMLSQIPVWGQYEYVIISRCPELKHIIDTACEVFDVNPKNEDWHAQLIQQFEEYRQLEFTDNSLYKQIAEKIAERFCNPTNPKVWRIGDIDKLGILSGEANKFIEREIIALSKSISKAKLNPLSGDPLGTSTSELTELMMVMLGVDQYVGEPIKNSERAAALCKMVHELHIDRVDTAAKKKARLHIKPQRAAFKSIIGQPIETLTIEDQRYTRYHISKKKLRLSPERRKESYDGILLDSVIAGIDLDDFDVDIIFSIREKDKFSRYRKFLSQGILEHPEREMTDEFGFMFALDMDKWKIEFTEIYPHVPEENVSKIAEYYSIWAIQRILLNFHDSIQRKREALRPTQKLDKKRAAAAFKNILTIEEQSGGSPGSDSESFGWIKYGFMLEDKSGIYELEWQIFKTLEDLLQKKRDDPKYDIKRRFQFIENRYSMMATVFGSQEAYDEAMKEYLENRSADDSRPDSLSQKLYLWTYLRLIDMANFVKSKIVYQHSSS